MQKMVSKIISIIKGTYYNILGKHNLIYNKRMNICLACPKRKRIILFINICGVCGCILRSKTRVLNEHCPLNKW